MYRSILFVTNSGMQNGVVLLKITDDIIKQVRKEARKASGEEKYDLYQKYRLFLINKGRYLIKTD
jgi:hypothetical protein